VNSDEVTRLFANLGSDKARRDLWGIYGHEYGHWSAGASPELISLKI
jgi:hypothetical protein